MTILVVGDSFMSRDQDLYIGKHWSELIKGHEVINYSLPGASNNLILHHVFQGIHELSPTAIVMGFTDCARIEFKNNENNKHRYTFPDGSRPGWITSSHAKFLNSDQKLAAAAWQATADHEFNSIRDAMNIVNMLYFVEALQIPFVFTLGIFKHNLGCVPAYTKEHLVKFDKHQLHTNLTDITSSHFIDDCCFHLPQPYYQKPMASEVLEHLTLLGF